MRLPFPNLLCGILRQSHDFSCEVMTINGTPRTALRIEGDKVQKMIMTVTSMATHSSLASPDISVSLTKKLPCPLESGSFKKALRPIQPGLSNRQKY